MTKENCSNSSECMVLMLFDEWKFRLSQYWSITSKVIMLNFILFFISYMKEAWHIVGINMPNVAFPIMAMFFATLNCCISSVEMKKINLIKETIKGYIRKNFDELSNAYKTINAGNVLVKSHHHIPLCIWGLQMILGIIVIFSLL